MGLGCADKPFKEPRYLPQVLAATTITPKTSQSGSVALAEKEKGQSTYRRLNVLENPKISWFHNTDKRVNGGQSFSRNWGNLVPLVRKGEGHDACMSVYIHRENRFQHLGVRFQRVPNAATSTM